MEIKNDAILLNPFPFTTILGNNNNIFVRGTVIAVTTSNNLDKITGIEFFGDGHLVEIINISVNTLIITHNDAASAVGNRIITDTGQPLILKQWDVAKGFYLNGFYVIGRVGTKGKLIGQAAIKNTVDFTFLAINTATPLTFNLNEIITGSLEHSTVTNPSRITATEKGILEVITNVQLFKAGGGVGNIFFWFRKNGVDIANSAYTYDLSVNENRMLVINGNFEVNALDYVEVLCSVTNINIRLESQAAAAPVPAIPSAILEAKLFTPIV